MDGLELWLCWTSGSTTHQKDHRTQEKRRTRESGTSLYYLSEDRVAFSRKKRPEQKLLRKECFATESMPRRISTWTKYGWGSPSEDSKSKKASWPTFRISSSIMAKTVPDIFSVPGAINCPINPAFQEFSKKIRHAWDVSLSSVLRSCVGVHSLVARRNSFRFTLQALNRWRRHLAV